MASPYRKVYFNQSQTESDHKDILVSELKAECYELRQNDRDYQELNTRVLNINHRFNLLQNEKALDEKEHNYRNELGLKTIATLREEAAVVKADLNAIEADIQDARADNESVNLIVRNKTNELAKLKGELADLTNENSQLTLDIKELTRQAAKLENENKEHTVESLNINDRIEEARGKKTRNERLVAENEKSIEKLLRINDDLKAQQEEIRANIREKVNVTKNAEQTLSENKKKIITLEARINDRRRANEKLRAEITASQQDQDDEIEKAAKINTKIRTLEGDIDERDDELNDLRRQVTELRKEQLVLLEGNDALLNDVKASSRHLDVVTVQNYNLLDELERVNQEDEEIRQVLSRKGRIHGTTSSCADKMKASTVKLNSTLQSPMRTASTKDGFDMSAL